MLDESGKPFDYHPMNRAYREMYMRSDRGEYPQYQHWIYESTGTFIRWQRSKDVQSLEQVAK